MNKQGVVFTVIVVILLSVILLTFLINVENRANIKIKETTVEAETLNSFVSTLNNQYLPLSLRTSSNQVILALLDYLEDKNAASDVDVFLTDSDINSIFKEALIDGNYVDGTPLDLMTIDGVSYKINDVLNEIGVLAADTGISFSYQTISQTDFIRIEQQDPWNLKVIFQVSYTVEDSENEFLWDVQNKEITTLLNIKDYIDPLYIVKTGLNLSIKKWNGIDFTQLVYNQEFNSSDTAPSFLQRLQGDLSANVYGIETILSPRFHANPTGNSHVDYLFWNNVPGECTVDVNIIQEPEFRLDKKHFNLYNLEGDCGEGDGGDLKRIG